MAGVATAAQWVDGARPRTLPAAVAPVLVGSGTAALADAFAARPAALALVVALGLQIGVNYANDYSDGIRGTDDARVGPPRLVGSGLAEPAAVRRAAGTAVAVACLAGLALAALSGWWLLLVGAVSIGAAWAYTGTSHPYGYLGLGEVSVFVFFGLVAVCGTTYVQVGRVTSASLLAATGIGALACAILVANNLRDLSTDAAAGKRTLAVRLGEPGTRVLYVTLQAAAFGVLPVLALHTPWALLGLVSLPLAVGACRTVLAGARAAALVPVLAGSGRTELVWAAGLTLGLVLA